MKLSLEEKNYFFYTLFNIEVVGINVLKQESELLPTASKKLTQPLKVAYQAFKKYWTF